VNIPKHVERYNPERDCQKGCVIWAIEHYQEILANGQALEGEREEALKFLVHFVGDIHQPLHCGYESDSGGNEVFVMLQGSKINLHQAWDSSILWEMRGRYKNMASHVGALLEKAENRRGPLLQGTVLDWVGESRVLLRKYVYDFGRRRVLEKPYLTQSVQVIDDQLLKAGIRLAGVLNQALGDGLKSSDKGE
jgi:hypothetical protein